MEIAGPKEIERWLFDSANGSAPTNPSLRSSAAERWSTICQAKHPISAPSYPVRPAVNDSSCDFNLSRC